MEEADIEMPDAEQLVEPELEPRIHEIRVLPGSTETAASYVFTHQDHTIGNALRYIIQQLPGVEFCAYTMPHPAEPKMHLRIQTFDDKSAQDILEKALTVLSELCDVVTEKFKAARDEFESERGE